MQGRRPCLSPCLSHLAHACRCRHCRRGFCGDLREASKGSREECRSSKDSDKERRQAVRKKEAERVREWVRVARSAACPLCACACSCFCSCSFDSPPPPPPSASPPSPPASPPQGVSQSCREREKASTERVGARQTSKRQAETLKQAWRTDGKTASPLGPLG